MRIGARTWMAIGAAMIGAAGIGYSAYLGWVASGVILHVKRMARCETPAQRGWPYEAINYDIADDARLAAAHPGMQDCTGDQGERAGTEVVTSDGIRIAGWYIPSAAGDGPCAPTIVLVHGWGANKSDMLRYADHLHDAFNLVLFDLRSSGRSTGSRATLGVHEQRDLHAILDWLERAKGPTAIGVLGDSGGAATAISQARTDRRIGALVLDSAHARAANPIGEGVRSAGHPKYPGVWATLLVTWLRAGVNLAGADPIRAIPHLGDRPVLLLHGTADDADLPRDNPEVLLAAARRAGVHARLEYCPGAAHGQVSVVCADRYAAWVVPFFRDALGGETGRDDRLAGIETAPRRMDEAPS
jgi:pimeloyl-ACP methyl ester carboxylesterase